MIEWCTEEFLETSIQAARHRAQREGWRLPTIVELITLIDFTRFDPAIDTIKFPNCRGGWYWSDTPCVGARDGFWGVNFTSGKVSWSQQGGDAFVRLVR